MASERVLISSPSLLPLFARAASAMIPGASRLPLVGGGARGKEVPEVALTLSPVDVDRDRLAAYDRVCGYALSDVLPPTYPHILAFPLHLAIMTDSRFPFPAIGLVHIRNEIAVHRPVRASESLSLRVWPTPVEPHPRGVQFSLRTEARVGEELVWEEVSTNLKRGSGGGGSASAAGSSGSAAGEPGSAAGEPSSAAGPGSAGAEPVSARGSSSAGTDLPATATWRLRGDLGRRYAAVSGDMNPIHMHSLSAKLFGFPSAIAHGMWTKARCLAALEGQLPDTFKVDASFKRPIILPATVHFAESASTEGVVFGVRDAKKATPHLEGTVSFG